jgi:hypothetical protein
LQTFTPDDPRVSYRERDRLTLYTIRDELETQFEVELTKTPFDIVKIPI